MSLFATLNPEQNGYVQVARNSPSPFDIGACFDAAFGALKRDFGNLVLRNFVFMLALVPLALLALIPIVGQIAVLLLVPPLVIGYGRHNLKVIRGEQASYSDLFGGFDCFGQGALMYLVMAVLLLLGFLALIIPGIYLAIAWSYSWKLLGEKRGSFWECMEIVIIQTVVRFANNNTAQSKFFGLLQNLNWLWGNIFFACRLFLCHG